MENEEAIVCTLQQFCSLSVYSQINEWIYFEYV